MPQSKGTGCDGNIKLFFFVVCFVGVVCFPKELELGKDENRGVGLGRHISYKVDNGQCSAQVLWELR